jgi:uncharacterized membrane protein
MEQSQMITFLVNVAMTLKPFYKFTYLLAIVLVVSIVYQLFFAVTPSVAESNSIMLSLLALVWLALINLMVQIFSRVPAALRNNSAILARIKNTIHRSLYYLLSLLFITITIAVILLSLRMLRV